MPVNHNDNQLMPTGDFNLLGRTYTVYAIQLFRNFDSTKSHRWCIAGPTKPDLSALWYEYSGSNTTRGMGEGLPGFIDWLRANKGFVQFEQHIMIQFNE